MSEDKILNELNNILGNKTETPMPDSTAMIAKGVEILSQSPFSFPLIELMEKENINVHVVATMRESSYAPESKDIYIGITKFNPTHPTRFILLMADALLEAKLELDGIKQPALTEQKDKYISETADKKAKKIAHLCSIAFDLDQKEHFSAYHFIDEMHKMGHNEAIDVFIANL